MRYLLLFLLLPSIVNAMCLKPTAIEGAVADTITTGSAIYLHGLTEYNPAGFAGSTAIKVVALWSAEGVSKEQQQSFNDKAGAIWGGAAMNNIASLVGAANPVSIVIGIISGIGFYNMSDCSKKDE